MFRGVHMLSVVLLQNVSRRNTMVNPLKWPPNHKAACLIVMALCTVAAVIIGYVVYAVGSGADGASSFFTWLERGTYKCCYRYRYHPYWWGVFGAAFGFSAFYVRRLMSN